MGACMAMLFIPSRKQMETNAAQRIARLKSSAALEGILFLIYDV